MTSPDPAPYRVLARKYRPQTFDDLIGQEPMVTTVSNAFATGRIPQAWMLTGVRGVGKTTTARILARALNYAVENGADEPAITMPAPGIHCAAIMEGRHVDVIEMDAASHNGVADIREITDAARYKPVSARFKVYILDEVHMLSSAAFNALLKTLEEPPEHVKFVFATTEIRKVPVTVLSRCQRFDLRRIPADMLIVHLGRVAEREAVAVDDEALRMIARAAEGSVRDALSLLDQAIARGAGRVAGESVKDMLGLADRARVIDLFEHVMKGDAAAAVRELDAQYAVGAEPVVVLSDLANFCHLVTRLKIVPSEAADSTATEEERTRGAAFAASLGVAAISRAWQGLLKGIAEVQAAARPLAAAEMLIVRLAYMGNLPTPEDALRTLAGETAGAAMPATVPAAAAPAASALATAAPAASTPASSGSVPQGLAQPASASAASVPAPEGLAQPASRSALPPSAPTALGAGAGSGGDGTASSYAAVAGGAQRAAHALRHDPCAVESIAASHETAVAPADRDAVSLTTPEPAAAWEPAAAPMPAATAATAVPAGRLRSLADVAALAAERRAIDLKHAVETQMRPVRFEPGHIEVELARGAPATLAGRLGARLTEWTGERWIVSVVSGGGAATLAEAAREAARLRERDARGHPLVQAVLARFPGAEIVDVRINEPAVEEGMLDAPPDDDQTGPDDD